jgi:hypothetical protein
MNEALKLGFEPNAWAMTRSLANEFAASPSAARRAPDRDRDNELALIATPPTPLRGGRPFRANQMVPQCGGAEAPR